MIVVRAVRRICLFSAATLALISGAEPSERAASPDKSGYSILNPTPRALLRELVTDRPDKTESPYTVDAGHYQIELDFLSYTYSSQNDAGADKAVEDFAIAPINFKVGLLNTVDLQVIAETYNVQRTSEHTAHHRESVSGFGDIAVRLKTNFWGNDGGKTAFGVMPFVKFPTNQQSLGNHAVEGGIIFPIAIKLPRDFDLGAMTEVDYSQNEERSGYHEEFINSITISHAIAGRLSGYAEFFSSVSTERDAEWVGTFDFGFTYGITQNVQLDAGLNVGLTRSADDMNPFIGLSVRY